MRNQTDPQAIAEFLAERRERFPTLAMTDLCDMIPWGSLRDYPEDESMCVLTRAEYIEELRAQEGPEAAHMLAKVLSRT